jgi:hypothetical protein
MEVLGCAGNTQSTFAKITLVKIDLTLLVTVVLTLNTVVDLALLSVGRGM